MASEGIVGITKPEGETGAVIDVNVVGTPVAGPVIGKFGIFNDNVAGINFVTRQDAVGIIVKIGIPDDQVHSIEPDAGPFRVMSGSIAEFDIVDQRVVAVNFPNASASGEGSRWTYLEVWAAVDAADSEIAWLDD